MLPTKMTTILNITPYLIIHQPWQLLPGPTSAAQRGQPATEQCGMRSTRPLLLAVHRQACNSKHICSSLQNFWHRTSSHTCSNYFGPTTTATFELLYVFDEYRWLTDTSSVQTAMLLRWLYWHQQTELCPLHGVNEVLSKLRKPLKYPVPTQEPKDISPSSTKPWPTFKTACD